MTNFEELKQYKHIYMIGIGGVSMSGLAEILSHYDFKISGSDAKESENTKHLQDLGIEIHIGHAPEQIQNADLVVYSAAIPETDPERIYAVEHQIPLMERSVFLGEITRCYKECICISGTHGKTTTTSMVSMCFLEAKKDPTIEVGGFLKAINGNNRVGKSEYFILEACEFVDSFLEFHPHAEIVLNIDNDHLDYFKNIENIKKSFGKFISLLDETGLLVINADDQNSMDILNNASCNVRTYGIKNNNAEWTARDIHYNEYGYPIFTVYHNNEFYHEFELEVLGTHNIMNALATIALCDFYQLDKEDIKNGLKKFHGANRRFEKIGTYNGIPVFDDYAHHPTEIETTYESSKQINHHETWAIFEPHTFTRTEEHLDEFAEVLKQFDHIIIADIYAAREINTSGISANDIVKKITPENQNCFYIPKYEDIIKYIKENVKENDIIITIGAGTINQVGYHLINNQKKS